MALAKSNKLAPMLVGITIFIILVIVLINVLSGDSVGSKKTADDQNSDKDISSESLASLSAQVESLTDELLLATKSNNDLVSQTNQGNKSLIKDTLSKIEAAQQSVFNKVYADLSNVQRNYDNLERKLVSNKAGEYPVGKATKNENSDYIWVSTGNAGVTTSDTLNLVDRLKSVAQTGESKLGAISGGGIGSANSFGSPSEGVLLPAYTIPSNATLMGSKGMTAVIGRVPINGTVTSPMPFKVITGREAFTANGMELPEVEKAVWTGIATGDATLECVYGTILSVTFVFKDGTIKTHGDPNIRSGSSDGIGFISNDQGFQCLPGTFVSNAGDVMKKLITAGTVSGFARGLAQNQTSTSRTVSGLEATITGDQNKFALGVGLSQGFSFWADYVAERAKGLFDAVVLQPGQKMVIHTTEQIPIDYNVTGRKLRHVNQTNLSALGVD